MAEVSHIIYENTNRDNVFSTSFTNHYTVFDAADLEDSTEYLLICSNLVMASDVSRNDYEFRLAESGSELGDSYNRIEPRDSNSTQGEMMFYMDRHTTPATAVDITMQGRCINTPTSVVRSNCFYGMAIKLADMDSGDYAWAESTTNLTSLSNSGWTEGTSITIGDGSSDWVVFCYGRVIVDHSDTMLRMRITDDGVEVGNYVGLSGEDTAEERSIGAMFVLEGIASSDIALEFQTDDATSGRMDIDRCAIFAMRLNQFEDYFADHDPTDTEMTVVDTDYGTISVSHTTSTGAARDWMVAGMSTIFKGGNDGNYRMHIKNSSTILVGDSTDISNGIKQRYAGSNDRVPTVRFGEQASVADATSWTIEIKNQEDLDISPTPDIVDAHVAGWTWELAAAGGGQAGSLLSVGAGY